MWWVVVLVVAVTAEFVGADVKTGVNDVVLQRLKRTPNGYDCPSYYPPQRPDYPRRPYWPPPPPPPPPPFWPRYPHHHYGGGYQAYSLGDDDASAATAAKPQPPCDKCSNDNSAVSNAQSETGQAVAVAIARAQVKTDDKNIS